MVDNFSGHGTSLQSEDGQIRVMFLPPNTTAVIQPMDQNPIKVTKLKYRNSLLSKIVANDNQSVADLLMSHNIKDAIILLNEAWNSLPDSVLKTAWKPLLNWRDDDFDDEDLLPLTALRDQILQEALVETQEILMHIANNNEISIEEVMQWNADEILDMDDEGDVDEAEEEENSETNMSKVEQSEAMQSVNVLVQWCNQRQVSSSYISNLVKLRTEIVAETLKIKKNQRH